MDAFVRKTQSQLCQEINAYWLKHGFRANARTEPRMRTLRNGKQVPYEEIVSDTINGHPWTQIMPVRA